MNSLTKNSFYSIIYKVVALLFPLATSMYVSRILLPSGIGVVSYAQNIASYFVALATLGLPAYCIREIAKRQENDESINKTFTELFIINAIFSLIASSLYLILIFLFSKFRFDIWLFLACGIQVFLNFFNIDWFFQGKENYKYIALRSTIIKFLSFIVIVIFVKQKSDYILYAFISSLAMVCNYFFNIYKVREFVRLNFKSINIKQHLNSILILAFIAFLGSIYNKIDVTMMGSLSNDIAIGLYSNAHKYIEVVLTVCTAITAVFLPRLSNLYHDKKEELYLVLDKGWNILSFLSIPAAFASFVLATPIILVLFGEEFVDASSAIRIFSPLIIIRSFGDLYCYQLLVATGLEKRRIAINIIGTIINVVFNAALIPQLAQNGAAIASIICELVINLYLFIIMKKEIKFNAPLKPIFQALLSSIAMTIVLYFVVLIDLPAIFTLLISVILGFAIYLLINILLKNSIAIFSVNKVKTLISKKRIYNGEG